MLRINAEARFSPRHLRIYCECSKRAWLEMNLKSKRSAKNPQSVIPARSTSWCMARERQRK
jgi:hypothetical protein